MPRYDLAGRTVVVTGSTGGLGTALAQGLRDRGANLALLDLHPEAVHAQARTLGGENVARGWRADVRNLRSLQATMDEAAAHFGRIDVVIAGAGITTMAPMATITPAAYERVIDINLNGVWRTFRAGLPHVQEQRGYLLAISSMAAFVHSPLQASYTASKAGVWAMCDSLRLELRHLGVGVASAHPTFFHTPMLDDVLSDPAGQELWGGNAKGIWKVTSLSKVINRIVTGIECRANHIVVPRKITIVAKAPELFRPVIERLGFRRRTIIRAIALASSTGWHNPEAINKHETKAANEL
ncbi:SDR family NAD(P)-dependent oxidoreductase [Streptomyces noursei]|uniref:SDR family NAD(P)-dependent oxidoreductase n=1 Tax=Streptomyces noursei TaxID=1971 RepID=UPI00045EEE2B|nr:SDR family NAD(P)-dependent oxidoreductase [Streptomyces noursei]AIA01461.1 short-chain dehydrogenase/reductase SDR [Streptomyces noursei]